MRDSFILHRDFLGPFEELTDEQAGELIKMVMRYVFDDETPETKDQALTIMFVMIKGQIDRFNARYEEIREKRSEAGKMGGRPKANALSEKQKKQMVFSESKKSLPDPVPVPVNKRFIPPTLEEVSEYVRANNYSVDPDKFIDFYESKGWMVGKNKMKDWRAAVRTWAKDSKPKKSFNFEQRDTDYNSLLSSVGL